MKKYISVFGLYIKGSFLKILSVILFTFLAEAILFGLKLREAKDLLNFPTFESLVASSSLYFAFAFSFVAVCVLLCLFGCSFGSVTPYTVKRLSIDEGKFYIIGALYNMLVFALLIFSQAVFSYILGLWYIKTAPESLVSTQTLFLSYFKNDFLHALLPLSDIMLWIRNLILIIALGFTSAKFPFMQRRGKYDPVIIALALFTLIYFEREISTLADLITVIIIAVAVFIDIFYSLPKKLKEEELINE